ncbi:ABC transporter ATP-binding protein/permease [Candidatus Binatia bacterium]|nr:ABC transporter ATP-binding protein/permease [Candidatus Binatia bacterium]
MHRLWGYVRRYRRRYAVGCLCLLATASLAMAIPYLLKRAVDAVGAGAPASRVATFALTIVAIALAQAVVRTLSRSLIFNVGRDVEYDLRNDLFRHLERLPLAFYQRHQTGDLMSRLVNDVTAVRMLLGVGVLNLINTPIYYAYGVAIMLALDARLTLAALIPYPLLLIVVKFYSRRILEDTLRVQEGLAALSSDVQENLSGMHVVRAYAAEEIQARIFAAANERFKAASLKLARSRGQLFPLMRAASSVGTLVVLWYGSLQAIAGRLSLGDMVAFIGYLNLLAWPTLALGWILSVLQRGRAAMRRLEEILDAPATISDRPGATPLPVIHGAIAYRDVTFAYPTAGTGRTALRNVTLAVAPGRQLALIGRTGAGKSTLAMLLPRLFDAHNGTVLLDGRDVRTMPLAQLRRAIAYVPQDPFLFSATVRDNIRFGADHADDAAVRTAATVAGVATDIESFPRGYDTVVGERGITLSGGQKQRLTIARALLRDAPVLVLDDALSSVDTRTERTILTALESVVRQRTRIVVSHRISTVQNADVIAVIDEGQVVEIGNHATLMARGGLYADLARQQRLEEEIAAL